MRLRFAYFLPLLLLTLFFVSCEDDADCTETNRPMVSVRICKADGSLDTIPFLTVTVMESDSVLVNKDTNVTRLSLPLSYRKGETHWVLHYSNEKTDTIHLGHTNTPYFLNPDCGYQMRQELKDASSSRHYITQTEIKKAQILNDNEENLWIYLE